MLQSQIKLQNEQLQTDYNNLNVEYAKLLDKMRQLQSDNQNLKSELESKNMICQQQLLTYEKVQKEKQNNENTIIKLQSSLQQALA